MKVVEAQACTYYAIQMEVQGRGVWDSGSYRYNAGDWLLFSQPPEAWENPVNQHVDDASVVVQPEEFKRLYLKVME